MKKGKKCKKGSLHYDGRPSSYYIPVPGRESKKHDNREKMFIPEGFIFKAKETEKYYISTEKAHELYAMLDAIFRDAKEAGEKYISSPRLNIICEIEARFLEKVLNRVRDEELNTFDLYQDVETLFLLHQMHMDSLSLVHKV